MVNEMERYDDNGSNPNQYKDIADGGIALKT